MTLDPNKVLTKAALRAAQLLGLEDIELARALGIDLKTLGDLRSAAAMVQHDSAIGKRCLSLIRVHQALNNLVGGNAAQMQLWLRSHNSGLGGVPMEFISTEAGMTRVVSLLEGYLNGWL